MQSDRGNIRVVLMPGWHSEGVLGLFNETLVTHTGSIAELESHGAPVSSSEASRPYLPSISVSSRPSQAIRPSPGGSSSYLCWDSSHNNGDE